MGPRSHCRLADVRADLESLGSTEQFETKFVKQEKTI